MTEPTPLVIPNPAGHQVVAPGQTVASDWGNHVWDQSTNIFASTADRDAQWATPPDGARAYTRDIGMAWIRQGGVWVRDMVPARGNSIVPDGTVVTVIPIIYAGTTVVTTDTNGGWAINYPSPFPNGVLTFLAFSGENPPGTIINGWQGGMSLTSARGGAYINNAVIVSAAVRINWLAVGW